MKRLRGIPFAIAAITAAVLALGALLSWRAESRVNKIALADTPKSVTVVLARDAQYRPSRRFVGTVEPWLSARVGPQLVSAYVGTVLVRPGDSVKRGQVLATLDCKNASTQSAAVAAQARALEEKQKALASEAGRLQELAQGGFVSSNELEQRQAAAAAGNAQVSALQAQLANKGLEVSDCILRAPFDGEVGARLVDPGAFVRPGSTVVTIIDRRMVRIVADVPERDAAAVVPDTPVAVSFFSSGVKRDAVVSRRSPQADPQTRTVRIEVDLDGKGAATAVGTTATLTVDVGEPQPSLEVPIIAAKARGESANIFVVEEDVVRARKLKILGESGGNLYLEPAIKAGTRVVTEGRGGLQDGENVIAKTDTSTAQASAAP